jgi:hypothetical protein
MPKRLLRHLVLPVAVLGLAAGAAGALAQGGGTAPGPLPPGQPPLNGLNPCANAIQAPRLRCPDLVMYRPYDLYYVRGGSRVRLRAGNTIVNRGTGPMELFGRRTGPSSMSVNQRIHRVGGGIREIRTLGHLFFKPIPGQGAYWKFRNAARFELWSTDPAGRPLNRVRIGAKLVYCLRDLNKRFSNRFSPRGPHFPGCGQDPRARTRTLGTSVGWSDDYPSPYPEQYIDVTGLRGRFAFFMVVDPLNQLFESNETNNRSPIVYLNLPPRGRLPRDRDPGESYP